MVAITDSVEKKFVGARLEKIRNLRGPTKIQLAERASKISVNDVHLTSNSITRYESGNTNPMNSTARAMADVLGISYNYLIVSEQESDKVQDAIEEMPIKVLIEIIKRRKQQGIEQGMLAQFNMREISAEIGRRVEKGELK